MLLITVQQPQYLVTYFLENIHISWPNGKLSFLIFNGPVEGGIKDYFLDRI